MKIIKQLLAADEQHQSDRGEQKEREIFAVMTGSAVAAREDHGEKGEGEADDLEERRERRDHEHSAKERGLWRQHEHCRRGEKEPRRCDRGANLRLARPRARPRARTTSAVDRDDRFRQRKSEQVEDTWS